MKSLLRALPHLDLDLHDVKSLSDTNNDYTSNFVLQQQQQQKMDITKLPTEVLTAIFGYLGESPNDLISCATTTRKWTMPATYWLYREPHQYISNGAKKTQQDDLDSKVPDIADHSDHRQIRTVVGGSNHPGLLCRIVDFFAPKSSYNQKVYTVEDRWQLFLESLLSEKQYGQFVRCLDLGQLVQNGLEVNDKHIQRVAQKCTNLRRLNLTGCQQITDVAIQSLTKSQCAKTIRNLNFSNCSMLTDASLLQISKSFDRLQAINLKQCHLITDAGLNQLTAGCRTLRRLRIWGCQEITDEAMESVAENVGTNLTWLDVGLCPLIGDDGLIAIADKCPNLQWLDISRAGPNRRFVNFQRVKQSIPLTDRAIMSIASHCPDLELLDLSHCSNITDISLIHLSRNSINIKSLSLKGLDKITRDSILELGELRRKYRRLIWLQIYNCKMITSAVIDEMIQRLNDGWRKGPYDTTVHREVMNGRSWEDVGS